MATLAVPAAVARVFISCPGDLDDLLKALADYVIAPAEQRANDIVPLIR